MRLWAPVLAFIKHITAGNFKLLALVVISLTAQALVITDLSFDFKQKEQFGSIYMSMLDHLKKGEGEVSAESVGFEAFVRNGKYYTYFGPMPALLRGVFELVLRRGDRDWSRWSCLLASAVASIMILLIFLDAQGVKKDGTRYAGYLPIACYLGAVFGSIFLGLLACAFVYHEAILWGLAWNCVFLRTILKSIQKNSFSFSTLLLLALSAGLALFSRVSMAVGPCLALVAVLVYLGLQQFQFGRKFVKDRGTQIPSWKVLASVLVLLGLFGGAHLVLNQLRWGSPLEFCPVKYHLETRKSAARIHVAEAYGKLKLDRAPLAIEYYFLPHDTNFFSTFPFIKWIDDSQENYFSSLRYSFDYIEGRETPMVISSAFLMMSGAIGAVITPSLVATEGVVLTLVLVAYGVGNAFLLFVPALAVRYQAEFLPLLLILTRNALAYFFAADRTKSRQWIKFWQVLLLLVVSIYLATITMLNLKMTIWAVPEATRAGILRFLWDISQLL